MVSSRGESETREGPDTDADVFVAGCREWLAARLPAAADGGVGEWGAGDDSIEVFASLDSVHEREFIEQRREYERAKFDAGYGQAITCPREFGGRELPLRFKILFDAEEARFQAPWWTELFGVTQELVAPTILAWGSPEQRDRFVHALLRADMLACQLFSEPDAGSDLSSVRTVARRDGDDWVVTGRKVWTSGANFADFGEAVCRSETGEPAHHALTVLMVPLDAPGVEIRPIRQMTGGSSFNEVVLDEVRVPDDLRIGPVGEGWRVALTTLSAERAVSGTAPLVTLRRLRELIEHCGVAHDPVIRQNFTEVYCRVMAQFYLERRATSRLLRGDVMGPEGSLGKLMNAVNAQNIAQLAASVLGSRLAADTGEWGTFAWNQYVLGVPALRIAGGTDEIQRNIIGERVLGLPREPRRVPREVSRSG